MTKEQESIIKEFKAKYEELHEICVRGEILDIFPEMSDRLELNKVDFALKEQIVQFEQFLNS